MTTTVKDVGYSRFKRLLKERYGKHWFEWINGVCPDGVIMEEAVLTGDMDETAVKLGWHRIEEKVGPLGDGKN